MLNCALLFMTPWTVAHQTPLSMRFPRQEYWSGLSCPSPGAHPSPGVEPTSTHISCITCRLFTAEPLGKCIMWNARLDELQAEIKITERSNHLRYADDSTLSGESVISLVLCRCNKDLKVWISVTAGYKAWVQVDPKGEAPVNVGSLL